MFYLLLMSSFKYLILQYRGGHFDSTTAYIDPKFSSINSWCCWHESSTAISVCLSCSHPVQVVWIWWACLVWDFSLCLLHSWMLWRCIAPFSLSPLKYKSGPLLATENSIPLCSSHTSPLVFSTVFLLLKPCWTFLFFALLNLHSAGVRGIHHGGKSFDFFCSTVRNQWIMQT